ncbi:hypothetical protein NXX53_05970 [Bacteroides salyersiae]|nr:hypothetical protein [Bacteroides salyersiae]
MRQVGIAALHTLGTKLRIVVYVVAHKHLLDTAPATGAVVGLQ